MNRINRRIARKEAMMTTIEHINTAMRKSETYCPREQNRVTRNGTVKSTANP